MDTQHKNIFDFSFKTEGGSGDGKMRFEGYLSVFGNVDSYGEVVEKGAYSKSIKNIMDSGRCLPVLENHGGWKTSSTDLTPIGYFESLAEDDTGLYVKGVLYNTARGRDMYTLLKESPKGQMGMSIGYRVIKQRAATREEFSNSGVISFLEEIELLEGSIVTFPANAEARVEDVKSEVMSLRTFERALKEEGFNAREAKTIISIFKKCDISKQIVKKDISNEDNVIKDVNENEILEVIQNFQKNLEREEVNNILNSTLDIIKKM